MIEPVTVRFSAEVKAPSEIVRSLETVRVEFDVKLCPPAARFPETFTSALDSKLPAVWLKSPATVSGYEAPFKEPPLIVTFPFIFVSVVKLAEPPAISRLK